MLFKDFGYKILFLPFIRIYIYSILLAVISSYFIAYESEYTLTLFEKKNVSVNKFIFYNRVYANIWNSFWFIQLYTAYYVY